MERAVGHEAMDQMSTNSKNTVLDDKMSHGGLEDNRKEIEEDAGKQDGQSLKHLKRRKCNALFLPPVQDLLPY
jgi:hypothetical protein